MGVTNLKAMVGKLNSLCQKALQNAVGLCVSRTNYNVEIEHWLLKLLEAPDSDLPRLLRHYEVDSSRVVRELTRSLDSLKTGNARPPSLSQELIDWVREAWTLASREYNAGQVRSGPLLAALLTSNLASRAREASAELGKLKGEKLQQELPALIAGGAEDALTASATAGTPATPGQPAPDSKTPALD